MKSRLKNGKIPTPISIYAAKSQHNQLVCEIGKMERRLADPGQIAKFPTVADYDNWHRRAKAALGYFKEEARQTAEWMNLQPEGRLLEDAWRLLSKLRDEVDMDPGELAVVDRLDVHFGVTEGEKRKVRS